MREVLTGAAVALSLLALPALAQSTAATGVPADTMTTTAPAATTVPKIKAAAADAGGQVLWYNQQANEMRASKLIGSTVRNPAGESIGEVNEVLFDNSGKVNAVVVGVGGFLGMGVREVAIAFSSLKMAHDTDGRNIITVDASKDTLKSAPQWTWPKV